MATESEDDTDFTDRDGPSWSGQSGGVRGALKRSFSLKMALAGLFLILVGYVLQTGEWPAILAIWGAALVLAGLSSYAFIRYSRAGVK